MYNSIAAGVDMRLKNLTIKNFRNYESQSVAFWDKINVFEGKNASGKTNLLEAVYLLGVGKSPRAANDRELIKFGTEQAYIKATVQKKYRTHNIEILITPKGKKIAIDSLPVRKLTDLVGVLNVVYFSPDELKFIKETPAERRRFLDISLSQQSAAYFRALIRYNRILAQRNKLLKEQRDNRALPQMLSVWDIQLAEYGAMLTARRAEYVQKLNRAANLVHSDISGGREGLQMEYENAVGETEAQDFSAMLLKKYAQSMEKDRALMYTTVGPHRDDLKIALNEVDVRKYGSQGQQRTAALSVKLAELDLFLEETGESPVLLLDDVLSELDKARREKLIERSQSVQTLITCTEFNEKTHDYVKRLKIAEGRVMD